MGNKLRFLLLGLFLICGSVWAEDVRVHVTVSGVNSSVAIMNKKLMQIKGVQFVNDKADYEVSVVVASVEGGYVASMAVAKTAAPTQIVGHWLAAGETVDIEKGCDRFVFLFKSNILEHKPEAKPAVTP